MNFVYVLCILYVLKWSEVKVTQSCLTLCDPMNYTAHGILQARILEWIAFPFSRGSSQPRDGTEVSCIAGGSLPAEPQGNSSVCTNYIAFHIFQGWEENSMFVDQRLTRLQSGVSEMKTSSILDFLVKQLSKNSMKSALNWLGMQQ